MPPRINPPNEDVYETMCEVIMIGGEPMALTRIEEVLWNLNEEEYILGDDEYEQYMNAIRNIRFDGVMPGLDRFPLPCWDGSGRAMKMYFLPALRVILDNFFLPVEEIQTIKLYWNLDGNDSYASGAPCSRYPFQVVSDDFAIVERRGDYWICDYDGDVIGFGDMMQDLDAIEFTMNNPDRPVSPLGLDEFPFDINDVPTDHLDAALILYQLWHRNNDGTTESESDGEMSNDDTEMGEFIGF